MHNPTERDANEESEYTAAIERALQMADIALSKLVLAYEHNDLQSVERMLANMSQRRSLVIARPTHPTHRPQAPH